MPREMVKRIYRGLKYGQAYVEAGEETHARRIRARMARTTRKKMAKVATTAEEIGRHHPLAR